MFVPCFLLHSLPCICPRELHARTAVRSTWVHEFMRYCLHESMSSWILCVLGNPECLSSWTHTPLLAWIHEFVNSWSPWVFEFMSLCASAGMNPWVHDFLDFLGFRSTVREFMRHCVHESMSYWTLRVHENPEYLCAFAFMCACTGMLEVLGIQSSWILGSRSAWVFELAKVL